MDNGLFGDLKKTPVAAERRVADNPQPTRPLAPPPSSSAEKKGLGNNRKKPNLSHSNYKNKTVSDNSIATVKPNCQCENRDVFLENLDRACAGNEYLKGMIMGEILNSPRFKGRK